jgi:flagellar protein FliS
MAVNRKAMNAYRSVGVSSGVEYADSVQLVQMLFDGLLAALADAEGHMQRNAIAEKGESINRASKILIGLQSTLDFEKGGELARNLSDLYDYAMRRILKANLRNDIAAIQEVRGLLGEITGAWELLPALLKDTPIAMAS